jgi:alpha-galactosidase/6-phospho-beta-glucosidase family protein
MTSPIFSMYNSFSEFVKSVYKCLETVDEEELELLDELFAAEEDEEEEEELDEDEFSLLDEELSSRFSEKLCEDDIPLCMPLGKASKSSNEQALSIHAALSASKPKMNFLIYFLLIANGNDAHVHALSF